jgi:hypothetical protein
MSAATEISNDGLSNVKFPSQPSLLHRIFANLIVQVILFFQFILPYIKTFLQAAYCYDREHKVSEQLLSKSIVTIDEVGRRSLAVTNAIYQVGDGRLGQAITETIAWLVEGIAGGIHEGIGQGIAIIAARKSFGLES